MYICSRCERKYAEPIERCLLDNRKVVLDRRGQMVGGRYTLNKVIGVGGMNSTVWSAWQTSTRRSVAVKMLPPSGLVPAERFSRGARIASNLNHPNITTVHDYGQTVTGDLFLVMELLDGRDLFRVSREDDLSAVRVVHCLDQVLSALTHAHKKNVVHRDIKLSNLFLAPRDDDDDFLKILDFGIARYIEGSTSDDDDESDAVTAVNQLCGTPQYMAPEQIGFGKVDARVDLYAVGISTFKLLTGQFPFDGSAHDLFRHHLQTPAPRISDVDGAVQIPVALCDWTVRAMAKKPADRFQTAAEMREALNRIDFEPTQPVSVTTNRIKVADRVIPVRADEVATSPPASVPSAQLTAPRRGASFVVLGFLFFFAVLLFIFNRTVPETKVITATIEEPSGVKTPDSSPKVSHLEKPIPLRQGTGQTRLTPPSSPPREDIPPKKKVSLQGITLKSVPVGSRVKRNGKLLGQTPLNTTVNVGRHEFEFSLPQHKRVVETIDVKDVREEFISRTIRMVKHIKNVERVSESSTAPRRQSGQQRVGKKLVSKRRKATSKGRKSISKRRRETAKRRKAISKRRKVASQVEKPFRRPRIKEPQRKEASADTKRTLKIQLVDEETEREFVSPDARKSGRRLEIELVE